METIKQVGKITSYPAFISREGVENIIKKAEGLCQPLVIGLTDKDKAEIKAYNTALRNVRELVTNFFEKE